MKESFVFYKSYEDAIACITDDAERLKAYEVLIKYALHGEKEDVDGFAGVVLNMAIPTIDANNRRYEHAKSCAKYGKLGGRPKKQADEPAKEPEKAEEEKPKPKPKKIAFGELGNVRLTEDEFERLKADYGEATTQAAIDYFDKYIAERGDKSKSHNLTMRRWVFNALKEREAKQKQIQFTSKARNFVNIETRSEDMEELERKLLEN